MTVMFVVVGLPLASMMTGRLFAVFLLLDCLGRTVELTMGEVDLSLGSLLSVGAFVVELEVVLVARVGGLLLLLAGIDCTWLIWSRSLTVNLSSTTSELPRKVVRGESLASVSTC